MPSRLLSAYNLLIMSEPTYDYSGKHVLVTGATGGLGSALVRELAESGAHLVVTSRSVKALEELISMLPEATRAVPVTADLSAKGEAERLAGEALKAMGHLDAIFNIAGIGYFALMEEATEQNIRHLFELNTFSPLFLIKALVPHMKERGAGRVVNIVSCAGRVPIPTVGVYGGSKSALAVMSNTMRLELGPAGIDVVNVYPGTIDTSFEENALREESRPGLCPSESCGLPKFDIAEQVMKAAKGPPGEVWLEREGRWLSTAALIFPSLVDRRLAGLRDRVVRKKSLKERRWKLFQVESSIACNLGCVMCPWAEIRKNAPNKGLMAQETWDAVKPYLSEVRSVDFTGGGEPLLQPRLVEWVKEANAAECETGILTGGLLLDRDKARDLIQAGMDWICISMDGADKEVYEEVRRGADFDKVCENVSALVELRRGGLPKIMINFVIMHMNAHQLEDMVRLARTLGVDQLNFKQCDVIRGERGKGFGLFSTSETREVKQVARALSRAKRLARKLNVKTTDFSFTPEEQPVCDQDPRNSLFIRHDGAVGPCINLCIGGPTTFLGEEVVMPTVHYGRVPEEDLAGVWESETCLFYRESFERRVKVHEESLMESFMHSSGPQRSLEKAAEAMPPAPEGCRVCHYLYNI